MSTDNQTPTELETPVTGQSITREALAALPIQRYGGPVCLVRSPEDLRRAQAELCAETVVGIDTETRPSFHKGQNYHPSLVQIAGASCVFLFQIQEVDLSAALTPVLESPTVVKTGVALGRDIFELKEFFPFTERNLIDLGDVAQANGVIQSGVRNLAGMFLGFRITKGARTSNWARPDLSSAQITYAATDAWVSRQLYLKFAEFGWLEAGRNGEVGRPVISNQ